MKLSPELCDAAAEAAQQLELWSAIGQDANVNVHGHHVNVVLKDGRAFSVEREGHKDYKLHGHVKPYADAALTELGKKFIKVIRKGVREVSKVLDHASSSTGKVAKELRKKYL